MGLPLSILGNGNGEDDGKEPSDEKASYAFSELLLDYLKVKYEDHQFEHFIYVSVEKQKLYHYMDSRIIAEFPISTSRKGTGNAWGSNKTPIGLHKIQNRIGEGIPLGGVFKKRQFTGDTANILTGKGTAGEDLVTSRILWLTGLEKGKNRGGHYDTHSRYIYIHGTPEEQRLGKPVSHGCIRMSNKGVARLFQKVKEGTLVFIQGD